MNPKKQCLLKHKNPAFSCRLLTAINQVINVLNLNPAIKQYCQPPLCPSCELLVVLITQRCVQGQFLSLNAALKSLKRLQIKELNRSL